MTEFRDILLAGIALGMPAYFVFRAKRHGILLGAAAVWLLAFLCGEAAYAWAGSPPQDNRISRTEDWLMGGWVFGLAYSYLVWLLNECLRLGRRGLLLYREQTILGFSARHALLHVWHELNQPPATTTAQSWKENWNREIRQIPENVRA